MIAFGYRKPHNLQELDKSKIDTICFHHTGNDNNIYTNTDYHMDTKKWAWVGYGVLINADQIYWCRGVEYVNAGVSGHNDHAIHVAITGNLNDRKMTQTETQSAEKVIDILIALLPNLKYIRQHKNFQKSECAGKHFDIKHFQNYFENKKNNNISEFDILKTDFDILKSSYMRLIEHLKRKNIL